MNSHSPSHFGAAAVGVIAILLGGAIAAVPGFQDLMPKGALSLKIIGCGFMLIGLLVLVVEAVKFLIAI